jgi:hypothetical protein
MSLFEIFMALLFAFMFAMMCLLFGVLFFELGENGVEESFKSWKRIFKK